MSDVSQWVTDPELPRLARARVQREFGTDLASKATDAFCVTFGADVSPNFAIESEGGQVDVASAVVAEFRPEDDSLEKPLRTMQELPSTDAWKDITRIEGEFRSLHGNIGATASLMLRQTQIRLLEEDFQQTANEAVKELDEKAESLVTALGIHLRSLPISSWNFVEACWLSRSLRVRMGPAQLVDIAASPDVLSIDVPRPLIQELNTSCSTIGAKQLRARTDLSGSGVIVAVIDGEINADPAYFQDRVVRKLNQTQEGWNNPNDHGTAVAGVIAACHPEVTGVAPGATIYNYKVTARNSDLTGSDFDAQLALQSCIEDGVQIANCSWGTRAPTDGKSRETRACNRAWDLGLTIVKSAGNKGPGQGTITAPGDARGVIVVGATNREGTMVPDYSSRGPTAIGEEVRPDLVSPGGTPDDGIRTVVCAGLGAVWGTSYAAPHLSGILALLLEQDRDRWPDDFRSTILARCEPLNGFDQNAQGKGLINAKDF